MPGFALDAVRTTNQVRKAAGFLRGALLPDRERVFWTMTGWDSQESMRRYMLSGSHKTAMPKLMEWCDEASVAHWEQEAAELPGWEQADRRMRETGRVSKVKHPAATQAGMNYRAPRRTRGALLEPKG